MSEHDVESNISTSQLLERLGTFLLEIRRSMGNEATKIDNWGMLEWFITDARQYKKTNTYE